MLKTFDRVFSRLPLLDRLRTILKSYSSFFGLFLASLFVAIWLNACGIQHNPQLKTLRVGMNPWPGYDVALYAKEAGLFENRGLDVEFVVFDVAQDSVRAMLQGNLDMTFASLWELMQADSGNDTPEYVMVTNISSGADGIVTQPGIESMKDLQGKRVAAKLGTVSHQILLEALQWQNLQPQDVQIEDIPNELAAELLRDGELDGAVLWEPSLSQTTRQIKGNIVFTTQDVDSMVIDGLVSRSSFVEAHSAELTQFILAWFDLMHLVETQPAVVFEGVGHQLGQSGESFARDYAGLRKGDLALNQRMFAPQGRLQEAQQQMMLWLRKDLRHSRAIREDLVINPEPITAAIEGWKP